MKKDNAGWTGSNSCRSTNGCSGLMNCGSRREPDNSVAMDKKMQHKRDNAMRNQKHEKKMDWKHELNRGK